MAEEEILEVVDEEGEPVDQAPRSRVHAEALPHRVVHVILSDGEGRVWLQQRAETKETYPSRWTSSASGHVPAGQTLRQAARREVAEELGVQAPPLSYAGWVYVEDLDVGEREFSHVFAGVQASEPEPDETEVAAVASFEPHEIEERIGVAPGAFAKTFREVWAAARSGRLETDAQRMDV